MEEKGKITFTIEGSNYDKMMDFKHKHKDCLKKYPGMTFAQYEYSFIRDSIGELITIECVCGESEHLDGNYDCGTGEAKKREVRPQDLTKKLIETTLSIFKRPGMYLGIKSFDTLEMLLNGMLFYENFADSTHWSDIVQHSRRIMTLKLEDKSLSDAEKFDLFAEIFSKHIEENYPALLKDRNINFIYRIDPFFVPPSQRRPPGNILPGGRRFAMPGLLQPVVRPPRGCGKILRPPLSIHAVF